MFRGRLLFAAGYISLLVHVLFCVNCCNSSSCGDIHNISFPFRLKSNPVDNCAYKYVELECENNQTLLYLYSGKYCVQAINYYAYINHEDYVRGSISLVDVGIQRNNCSSLPLHSLTPYNFTETLDPIYYSIENSESFVALVSCEKPVKSTLLVILVLLSVKTKEDEEEVEESSERRHAFSDEASRWHQAPCSSDSTPNFTAAVCHSRGWLSAFLDRLKLYLIDDLLYRLIRDNYCNGVNMNPS
ncbi:hypothetical protein LOK49_LG07G00228 [Camellia lanceoleosa]|uniref:Uncharacterized protein n=1 Tax=Camellia lanceoleosa TaxID=1840588 RepID=A0ACC0HA78_9ERIC|nr:hypothetical protein LOK49_LG07G00228 [Camellia lanceoleosa]